MTHEVLGRKALNRATLDRQLLLRRAKLSASEALEHLVGLQAQTPQSWYVALWTRLAGFDAETLSSLLANREAVRIAVMRGTIHLVSARDALELRALLQPILERWFASQFGKRLAGLDRAEVLAYGRKLVEAEPLTFAELGRRMAERWPDRDRDALAQAIRGWAPLVQVPPRGLWRQSGLVKHTTAESWLGAELAKRPSVDEVVLRYLAAFGPASVKDAQTWSGLTRLNEVVERLGSRLRAFHADDGRILYDLPDAPRPDPETPAPVRYLYDYDNLLLSHADRSRVATHEMGTQDFGDNVQPSTVLVDGFTNASWKAVGNRKEAVLTIKPFVKLSKPVRDEVCAEGAALLDFLYPEAASKDVRILRIG